MSNGFMGRTLFVDLTTGSMAEEPTDESVVRDYLGGYGVGVKVLYDRMKPGVDPLGPDAMLGFTSGPLTGTPALTSGRYTVVGKSPLTGTWGDSSSGGDFGPYMKFAGYDFVFFTGISPKPVYLLLDEGQASLQDAAHLWGKDTQVTDDQLRDEYGKRHTRVSCIGQAGEMQSLIACVMNDKGRAAGRSGLGAVMGSKMLKAIVARGTIKVPMHDAREATLMRRRWIPKLNEGGDLFHEYGTAGITEGLVALGDSPVKNWGGSSVDFPTVEKIGGDEVISEQAKRYGCWRCTIACGGHMKAGAGRAKESHKPEYETLTMAGTNILNDDLESIIRFNDICNAAGLDTISAGSAVSFAVESFQNEIISLDDVGFELNWGDGETVTSLVDLIARREGIGEILADGVRSAAEKFGQGADEFAVHAGGQELPAHDPKFVPSLSVSYRMDATPGRHTQGGVGWIMGDGVMEDTRPDKYSAEGFGELQIKAASWVHVANTTGICLFGFNSYNVSFVTEFLETITGAKYTHEELELAGERIGTLRHMFNLREGLNPLEMEFNDRALGKTPQTEGPNEGVTIDDDSLIADYLRALDWDQVTTRPSDSKLEALGLKETITT
jgi:aldehyde:ferredoxin oxidoreductase